MWLYRSHVQHMDRDNSHVLTSPLHNIKGTTEEKEKNQVHKKRMPQNKHMHTYPPFHSCRHTSCFRPYIHTCKKYHLQSFIYNFSHCVTGQHYLVISTLVINDLLYLAALIFSEVPILWN